MILNRKQTTQNTSPAPANASKTITSTIWNPLIVFIGTPSRGSGPVRRLGWRDKEVEVTPLGSDQKSLMRNKIYCAIFFFSVAFQFAQIL